MGIRIHRVMGYGLTDVKVGGQWHIDDERFNPDSPLLSDDLDPTIDEYMEWIQQRRDDPDYAYPLTIEPVLFKEMKGRKERLPELRDGIIWDAEYGIGNVFVILPLSMHKQWHRSDDSIDWLMDTYLRGNGDEPQENWYEVFPHGFYPWSGSYMDARTGKRCPPEIMTWIRVVSSGPNRLQFEVPENFVGEYGGEALDVLALTGGFGSHKDAMENCRPIVPEDVRYLAEFGQIFKDPETLLQLRPILYTYWS